METKFEIVHCISEFNVELQFLSIALFEFYGNLTIQTLSGRYI